MMNTGETEASDDRPCVVLVEDNAHSSYGHFSKTFAEVAEGFVDAGCRVEVLVATRWAADHPDRRFDLHSYGRLAGAVFALSGRFKRLTAWLDTRGKWARKPGAVTVRVVEWLRTVATVGSARSLVRRLDLDPAGIVVFWLGASVSLVERLGGPHRWILRQHPLQLGPDDGRPQKRDPRVALALADPAWGPTWSGHPVLVASMAVARVVDVDRDEARRRLDLDLDARIALVVGSGHSWQRPEVVLEAFEDRDDFELMIVGTLSERAGIRDGGWKRPPALRGGYLSTEELDLHFAAADLVILSLAPDFVADSGVLLDAASHGIPVVVSTPCLPARMVAAHHAGALFDSGSASSLSDVLDRIDLVEGRKRVLELRDQLSADVVARQYLETFAKLGWRPRA